MPGIFLTFVTKNGSGRYQVLTDAITLKSGATVVFDADGSALIVHASADDNTSDPAGNSGDRVACGVITAGQPKK
jgi:superoxide dismutase, Cu-Zn family